MIRYICDYCDARFDEPEAVHYVEVNGDFKRRYTEYFCPICGEDSFSDADSCPKCGEAKLTTDTLCRDCRVFHRPHLPFARIVAARLDAVV